MSDEGKYTYKKVKSIIFGVLGPKMIKQMASAKVVTPELYDKEGYPVDGGLMDTRLGVIDPGLKCRTCGCKLKECIGHFGYIELARPVIHVKFMGLLQLLLRATCRDCGRAMISKSKKEKYLVEIEKLRKEKGPDDTRKYIKQVVIKDLATQKKCPHCKTRQQKITLEKPTSFFENEKRLSPIEIRTRMEKIKDDELLMFSMDSKFVRPEWLVLTVLPIPPVTMRPSITLESGERSEDDLTHKLGDIVRINQRLFENINAGAPEIIIEDLWDLLQYHVTTFFDNDIAQLPPARHRSGQPLKTITERIKSKEGRIRHNLAGKRTNFSARTVISPDPMISLNEVGVPSVIAMKLTVPERITEWNLEYLKKFVDRGPKSYPGANYVIRPDGKKKRITDEMKEQILEELQPGYTVERHLMDGDIAIFNRQPSLHKMSMMCHEIKVLPAKTFRLNPAVCAPYNADFDGDEMNLHIPQTEEARAEAEVLMKVETQLISSGFGLSVIGCIQDGISGNYILTTGMEMSRDRAVDIIMAVDLDILQKIPKKDKITGRELFSCFLPDDYRFTGKDKSGGEVVVKKGQLISGVMDTANLGKGSGIMLRDIHKKYGPKFTAGFISNVMKLGVYVIMSHGFTTSIEDTDLPTDARKMIVGVLDKSNKESEMLIDQFHKKTLETFPGKTMAETLELKLLEMLNKVRNITGEIVDEYSTKETGTIIMSRSGSRGKPLNLAQMAGCVGQQAMRGGRISSGYKNRTMSCFKAGDLSPSAHGFIRNSFKYGLTPSEFFFMGMTGRDSLMDTALRTPKSGYLYRRLANALQDLKVEYDDSVRDSAKKIVQFSYGEDSIDVSRSEKGTINVKRIIAEITED
ncbi:DNA-directed RNA polymerase subunit A' [Candidatus Woesearchaeota archaeon]|nr:DNA-directed RNA polymerase subunit A' [Candidatus Woesearchaeota archaeon]